MNSALTISNYVNFFDEKEKDKINANIKGKITFVLKCSYSKSESGNDALATFVYIAIYACFLLFFTLVTRTDLV